MNQWSQYCITPESRFPDRFSIGPEPGKTHHPMWLASEWMKRRKISKEDPQHQRAAPSALEVVRKKAMFERSDEVQVGSPQ
jgi:hypothetical protein